MTAVRLRSPQVPTTELESDLLSQLERTENQLDAYRSAMAEALDILNAALDQAQKLTDECQPCCTNEDYRILCKRWQLHRSQAQALVSKIAWMPPYDQVLNGPPT